MVIAIDFDGTCVSHEFPKVGKDIGAVPVLKKLVERGHNLILHTMRGDGQSFYCGELCKMEDVKNKVNPVAMSVLDDAVKWFFDNNIPLYGINNNPQQKHWTDSKKVFAHMYIDDSALGIPLKYDEDGSVSRPYVDWVRVEQLLKEKGLIDYPEKYYNTWRESINVCD